MKRIIQVILLMSVWSDVTPIVISNLNLIFETFNPMSMVRFFEFNDKGWNITHGCIQDMFLYLDGLHKDILWAVKLFDASTYYSGGMYAGAENRIGSTLRCKQLDYEFRLQYNSNNRTHPPHMLNATIVPFGLRSVSAQYKTQLENGPISITNISQTVCMPESCTMEDLKQVMSYSQMPNLRTKDFITSADLVSIRILNGNYKFYEDFGFYFLTGLTCLILVFGIFAKVYEKCTHFEANVNLRHLKRTSTRESAPRTALSQLANLNNNEKDSLTKLKMDPLADSMTVNNFNTNKHVNLVKVKKIKSENSTANTISLDILSGKCDNLKYNHYPMKSKKSIAKKLLLSFSWSQNFENLLSHKENNVCNEVPAVCGLKLICILWIHFIHICTILQYISGNKISFMGDSMEMLSAIESNALFALDTYFFLSGVTVAYLFYCTARALKPHNESVGFVDQLLHFSSMILYKILRIIFPYLVVLVILQITMKHFNDHSIIDIPSQDHLTCQTNMWRNVLFIDTFYPIQERCMIWSWHLSLEIHFFIVACIILLMARNHQPFAIVICLSFFISSFLATMILRYDKRSKSSYVENLARFNGLYDQPWARIAPYLLGMCLGYILFKSKGKIRIHWLVIICGWIASVLLIIGIALNQYFLKDANLWIRAGASSITHTVWSMILFWMILASISQHKDLLGQLLNSSMFIPLSKLSNCFLLVHPLVSRLIILNSDTNFNLSIGLIVTLYMGFTTIVFAGSFLLYMIYEAPFAAMLNLLYYKHIK